MNQIQNLDCVKGMCLLDGNSIDLILTSPPYDDLRTYQNEDAWTFETFKPIAREMTRVLKPGGVIVWVVNDQYIKGSRSGSSARQQLFFQDECGLRLHDLMVYEKTAVGFPASEKSLRYTQAYEQMYVFSKGRPNTVNLICDKKNAWAGTGNRGKYQFRQKDGSFGDEGTDFVVKEFSPRNNIWRINNSVRFKETRNHPAVFPDDLADGHIITWTNEGDIVLDPFAGSGTTCRRAKALGRQYIGFELNPEFAALANRLCAGDNLFAAGA